MSRCFETAGSKPVKAKLLKVTRELPEWGAIDAAAQALTRGGIVAFLTDTTYGLAASIYCGPAIGRLRRIKGRALREPFVVLAADTDWVAELASGMTARHARLMEAFWPGPLTIVFKASGAVPQYLRCREGTIALRVPDDTLTQAILRASGIPLAAPSANPRGKAPAASAREVIGYFSEEIDLVLDGGTSENVVPSTIVAVGGRKVRVLRQGRVSIGRAHP